MIDCAVLWFALSKGLYAMLSVMFGLGIAVGLSVAPHLPSKVKQFLGL